MPGNNMNQRYAPYQGEIKTSVPVQDINRAPLQYPVASVLPPIDKNRNIFLIALCISQSSWINININK